MEIASYLLVIVSWSCVAFFLFIRIQEYRYAKHKSLPPQPSKSALPPHPPPVSRADTSGYCSYCGNAIPAYGPVVFSCQSCGAPVMRVAQERTRSKVIDRLPPRPRYLDDGEHDVLMGDYGPIAILHRQSFVTEEYYRAQARSAQLATVDILTRQVRENAMTLREAAKTLAQIEQMIEFDVRKKIPPPGPSSPLVRSTTINPRLIETVRR